MIKDIGKKAVLPAAWLALAILAAAALLLVHARAHTAVQTLHTEELLVKKTQDDLLRESTLIAAADFVNASAPFQIKSVDGELSNFTDYYFDVKNVLKGQTDHRTIAVRRKGGLVGDLNVEVSPAPAFTEGERYMLFLFQDHTGGSFNARGDHYYIVGSLQGVYDYQNKDHYICALTGDEIDISALPKTLAEQPIDENYYRDMYTKALKENLESAFITQEEYDAAIRDLDRYATVLP